MKNNKPPRFFFPAIPNTKALYIEKSIKAPALEVWAIVGNFSSFDRFTDGLSKCQMIGEGIGQVRVKTFDSGEYVVDQLSYLDNKEMKMHFNIISTSLNIRNLWEFLRVEYISSTESKVVWEMAGEPKQGSQEDIENFLTNFARDALENINDICTRAEKTIY
ncbi:MAG: SRPBCC family protein [Acinetobacter venetianus]|uniref:SRPBCC family protein n=1 Tax=Acinetobacter venetianus TaxID=52133 RepID=UPI0035BE2B42